VYARIYRLTLVHLGETRTGGCPYKGLVFRVGKNRRGDVELVGRQGPDTPAIGIEPAGRPCDLRRLRPPVENRDPRCPDQGGAPAPPPYESEAPGSRSKR
jgi:hypothetical protein